MNFKVIIIAITVVTVFGCSKDEDTCNTDNITYTNTIASLTASCAVSGCHNAGSTNGSGSLANYADAKAFMAKGRTIGALRHEAGFVAMPQGGEKMSDCNISKIEKWIADGFPN